MVPEKQFTIISELRNRIVGGSLPPGARLPNRADLQQEFGVSPVTLQGAMHVLVHDGFIEPRGRNGTYVSDNPPHLSKYAIVLPHNPAYVKDTWSNFWRAICSEAAVIEQERPLSFPVFYGVDFRKHDDYARLEQDVREHRLAGLIFAFHPAMMDDSIIMAENLPRVAIRAKVEQPQLPSVYPDSLSFITRSLDYLQAAGRRRVALVQHESGMNADLAAELIESRGMIYRPYWNLKLGHAAKEGLRATAHLLTTSADRPDCVIICDDNLVPGFTAGLADSGIKMPDEMEIIAYTNFPHPTTSHVPARRIGFSVRRLMQHCTGMIDRLRRGDPVEDHLYLEAITEEEYARLESRQIAAGFQALTV